MDTIGPILGNILPIFVVTIAVAFLAVRSKTMHFECPNCWSWFKVSSLTFVFTLHLGFARYVTCPVCNYRALMTPVRDKE